MDIRLVLVVKAAQQTTANELASHLDTGNNTTSTFTVPLARIANPGVTFAYWCNWNMTTAQATALRNRLVNAGMEDAIVTGAEKATFVPDPTAKCYVFDAREGRWTPDEILERLTLQRFSVVV